MIGTHSRAQVATARLAELLHVFGRFTGGGQSEPTAFTTDSQTSTWSTFVTDGNLGMDALLGSFAVLCGRMACSDVHYVT